MKLSQHNFILLLFLFFPLGITAQSIFQNAYLTNYFNHTLTSKSAVSMFGELPYDGIGKNDLLYEVPNTVIPSLTYDFDANSVFSPLYGTLRGGQLNVNEKFGAEFFGSHLSEAQLTLTNHNRIGSWHNKNLISGYRNQNIQDRNNDGFRDLPTKDRLITITNHNWSKKRLSTEFNAFYMNIDEVNGATSFDKENDYLTQNAYGFGNETMQTGFVFNNSIQLGKLHKPIKNTLRFYVDGRLYDQSAFFGQQERLSRENVLNTFIAYRRTNILSKYSIGLAYRRHNINIDFNSNTYAQNYDIDRYSLLGAYESYFGRFLKIEAKGRVEYENEQIGFYPNVQLKGNIGKRNQWFYSKFQVFGGREKRLFLPTLEHENYLNSNRIIDFPELASGDYYERGYYLGGAWQMDYKHWNLYFLNTNLDISRLKLILRQERMTDYWIPIVYEPSALYSGNVNFERGADLWTQTMFESSTQFKIEDFVLKARYRFTKPDADYDYQLVPKHIWAFRLSRYRIIHSISSSLSYFYQGKQSINGHEELQEGTHRWDWMLRWNVGELTGGFFSGTSIVFGINNFTDNQQNNLIRSYDAPFSPLYDGSANLGQQFGRTFFIGAEINFD